MNIDVNRDFGELKYDISDRVVVSIVLGNLYVSF